MGLIRLFPNMLICAVIYVVGHMTPLIVQSSIGKLPVVAFVGQFLATLLPVLEHFNIQAAIASGRDSVLTAMDWCVYIGWATLYCLLTGEPVYINGDGETSRDFCFIDNCVQANLLAATAPDEAADQVYNVAFGERTSLNELLALIRERVADRVPAARDAEPVYRDFLAGDLRHSLADITKAARLLGYQPEYSVRSGLDKAAAWYVERFLAV